MNLASRLCSAAPASSMLASAAYVRRLQRGGSGRGVQWFAQGWEFLKGLGRTQVFRVVCCQETLAGNAAPARGEEAAAVDGAADGGNERVDGSGGSKPANGHEPRLAEATLEAPAQRGSAGDWEDLAFEHEYEEQSRGSRQRGLLVSLALHLEGVLMQRSVVLTSLEAAKLQLQLGCEAQGDVHVQQHILTNRGLLEHFLQTSVLAHSAAVVAVLVVIYGGSRVPGEGAVITYH